MALSAILGGVGAGVGLLSSLLGGKGKNDQIDEVLEQLKKQRYSDDQIARKGSEIKRMYGSMVDSMIGAGQYLNSDTARALQNAKLTGESIKAQLRVRDSMEQYNKQLDLKSAELEGQKVSDWSMFGDGLLSALNTGIQGYTTGEYLDMLNPPEKTKEVTVNDLNSPNIKDGKWRPNITSDGSEYEYLLDPEYQRTHSNLVIEDIPIPQNQISLLPQISPILEGDYDIQPQDGLYPYSERPRQSAEDRNNFLTDYRKREIAKGIRTPRNPNYQRFLRW